MALSWDNATSTVPRSIPSKPTPIVHPLPSTSNMPIPSSEAQQGDLGYLEHHVSREGRRLKIYRNIIDVDTGSRLDKKTIGTLTVKNGDGILMAAYSGYAESRIPSNSRVLDTAKWNNLALRHISRQIGFKFCGYRRDTAREPMAEELTGRFYASHVEVLLASWYVVYLLRTELGYADRSDEHLISKLKQLKRAQLGDKRHAFITLDKKPCRSCRKFLDMLEDHTDILFKDRVCTELGPVKRQDDGKRYGEVIDSEDESDEPAPEPAKPTSRAKPPRPMEKWRPDQWRPEDGEDPVSSYKKKTPQFTYPGYSMSPSPEEEAISAYWKNSPSFRPQTTLHKQKQHKQNSSIEEAEAVKDSPAWEDIGDDIMMLGNNTRTTPVSPETTTIKYEERQFSPALTSPPKATPQPHIAIMDGDLFARSAYKATKKVVNSIEDMKYELVEKEPPPPNRLNHAETRKHLVRLQKFRHERMNDENESIFKTRYAILGPKTTP